MITGFNTDVKCHGQVYHVQTEDKGRGNPVIETLVYTGGQIVCARKTSYADLLAIGVVNENVVRDHMEIQHRSLIAEIRDGTLSKEDLEPFGWNIISDQSFDRVVRTFVEEQLPLEAIQLELLEPPDPRVGECTTLKLVVTDETSERPVIGATVVVRVHTRDDPETELLSAETDPRGQVELSCEIPAKLGAGAALVCEAEAAGKTVEVRCPIRRRRHRASTRA